jgi:hypothetical protein
MLNDLSLEPQTSLAPSDEKLSAAIWPCVAAKVRASFSVEIPTAFTLPSSPPVASHLPSELMATFTPASDVERWHFARTRHRLDLAVTPPEASRCRRD